MVGVPTFSVALVGGVLVRAAAPASAATHVNCGDTLTKNTTLANDVGPCTADGVRIARNGIVLRLAGHTITGSHGGAAIPTHEQVGVRLVGVKTPRPKAFGGRPAGQVLGPAHPQRLQLPELGRFGLCPQSWIPWRSIKQADSQRSC